MNQRFTPTLRQIRAFVAVYQLRKLGAAAEHLHVTQSAVSVMLREMEQGLGCRLFDRTTRALQPTQAAAEAVAVAERILRDVDQFGAGLRDLTALRSGRVCVAITPTLAELVMPVAVERFAQAHPQVRVQVDDCAPDQFVARVLAGHADFGVGAPERAAADVDTEVLVADHLALVCRTDHPLARLRTVRWGQLRGHGVITVRPGYGIRPMVDGAAAQAGIQLDVVNEVTFLSTALWMTASGLGPSLMPSGYARDPAARGLVVRKLHAPVVSRNVSIVTRRGRSLSPAAQTFVACLRASMQAG